MNYLTKSALFVVFFIFAAVGPNLQAQTAAAGGPESKVEASISFPKIDRHPCVSVEQTSFFLRDFIPSLLAVPHYNPESSDPFQIDLRGRNLSSFDLRGSLTDLLHADFDTRTIWPPTDYLPKEFDWKKIMELGKNPGLGVRKLHDRGVTGRGVGIAIIDKVLLVDHQEFAGRIRLYEEINIKSNAAPEMHGSAVASIAVGKTIGVAPEADLYYIGSDTGDWGGPNGFTFNFRYYAQGIRRMLEINKQLLPERKIRAIAMQIGWDKSQAGYDDITAACNEAKAAGMLIISSSVEETHGFKFHGLGRSPLANPDDFASFEPGSFWAREFPNPFYQGRLFIPMDSRTLAGYLGDDEYFFCSQGGWSWCTPYIAGVYALACQVKPAITPDEFWSLAVKTGRTIEIDRKGKKAPLGPIIDPVALIDALKAQ